MENYDNNNFTHTHTFLWVSTDTEVENNYIYILLGVRLSHRPVSTQFPMPQTLARTPQFGGCTTDRVLRVHRKEDILLQMFHPSGCPTARQPYLVMAPLSADRARGGPIPGPATLLALGQLPKAPWPHRDPAPQAL